MTNGECRCYYLNTHLLHIIFQSSKVSRTERSDFRASCHPFQERQDSRDRKNFLEWSPTRNCSLAEIWNKPKAQRSSEARTTNFSHKQKRSILWQKMTKWPYSPSPRNVRFVNSPKFSGIVPVKPQYWSSRCANFFDDARNGSSESFLTKSALNGVIQLDKWLRNLISIGITPVNLLFAKIILCKTVGTGQCQEHVGGKTRCFRFCRKRDANKYTNLQISTLATFLPSKLGAYCSHIVTPILIILPVGSTNLSNHSQWSTGFMKFSWYLQLVPPVE